MQHGAIPSSNPSRPGREQNRARQIFIVEDHDWARQALARMLSLQPGLDVCGTAASAEQALEAIPPTADLLLTDYSLGGAMSGIDLVREARARWPSLRCVILSNHPATLYARAATDAGCDGYVEKGNAPALLEAIDRAFGATPGALN